jgi:hypothetical protein
VTGIGRLSGAEYEAPRITYVGSLADLTRVINPKEVGACDGDFVQGLAIGSEGAPTEGPLCEPPTSTG